VRKKRISLKSLINLQRSKTGGEKTVGKAPFPRKWRVKRESLGTKKQTCFKRGQFFRGKRGRFQGLEGSLIMKEEERGGQPIGEQDKQRSVIGTITCEAGGVIPRVGPIQKKTKEEVKG